MNAMNQVLALCLMMAVGVYARKRKFIDDRVEKGLNSILVNITLPMSIISSFYMEYDTSIIENCKKLILYSFVIHTVILILSKMLFHKSNKKRQPVLRFMTTFSNCSFMGFPILGSVYGEIGIFYASIFNIVFHIYVWTFGVMMFNTEAPMKESINHIIKNITIWAVVIGGIIFLGQIPLPETLTVVMTNLAALTTPLSMIIIGSMLCGTNIRELFKDFSLYTISALRLIVVPLAIFVIMSAMNIDKILVAVPTLIMAMPCAAIGTIIATDNDGDGKFASECIFITTVLSVITIPIFINLVR